MSDKEVLFFRSSKRNGNKSTEGDTTSEDDIWDDSLLIKAYDKAVHLAQQSYLKKHNPESEINSKVKKKDTQYSWKVGDKCQCQYSEDLKFYEADIISITSSTGTCVVRYIGYENEEEVPINKLKPSGGDAVRAKQFKEALQDKEEETNQSKADLTNHASSSKGRKTQPEQKKPSGEKKAGQKRNGFSENNPFSSLGFPSFDLGNSIVPPPPPPHIFNRLCEDESENEAMSAMLISWYMSGYHTGYYQGLKMAKKQ